VRTSLLAACLLLLAASPVAAQQLRINTEAGPYFVGIPIAIQITAADFQEEPEPGIEVVPPASGSLELVGVSPSVQTQITLINGRLSQSKDVEFVYRYRFLPASTGTVELGPFTVTQNGVTKSVGPARLEVGTVPMSDKLRVELKLPEAPVTVGERIKVGLEVWIELDLRDRLTRYDIHVPFFDRTQSFRFIDTSPSDATTELELQTAEGRSRLRARSRRLQHGTRRYLVLEAERTVIPLQPGRYELEPAAMIGDEAIRVQRDLFGRQRASQIRKIRASDRRRTLVVGAVPEAGRPESFAGAVGEGFSLEAGADRSVVQVGDPITITLTLRGDGNLENASMPPLHAEGLLPEAEFRVPEGDLTGSMEGEAKVFTAVVRVLKEGVREIPALAYSWFNPRTRSYETAASRPIALSVGEAELVSAADVVRAEPALRGAAEEETAALEGLATGRSFELTGADLAIVRQGEQLLRDDHSTLRSITLPIGLYIASALIIALALADRRLRSRDPVQLERRRRLRQEVSRVARTDRLPPREAARELASALRSMRATAPASTPADLESFLGECDARSYAPEGSDPDAKLDAEFHGRALRLAREIEGGAQ
jgi:hypothetical protein